MKRIIAIIAALLFSLSLTGCGSNNQASAIKAACELAVQNDFALTSPAFSEIAANDSGYLSVARGAKTWTQYEGKTQSISSLEYPSIWDDLRSFYAICDDL